MPETAPLYGTTVTLRGSDYVIPPLNLEQIQRLAPDIVAMRTVTVDNAMETVPTTIRVVHDALKTNYPDITPEDVAGLVDFANLAAVVNAIMGVSGLARPENPPQGAA